METEEKTGCKGGCACKQTTRPCNEVSKSEPISVCPECQGVLKFGSRDPCEGDLWWCSACGYGPITYPLFGGPAIKQITSAKELLGIIDAEKEQENARISRLLAQGKRYQETGDIRSFQRPVIDADKANETLRTAAIPKAYKRPVIVEEPIASPHEYLDRYMENIND
jgi:hypothetical protein